MLPAKRLFNAYDAMIAVEKEGIVGAVAECGVWSGGCVGLMALASRHAGNASRPFHLFDSFEGLPQPSAEDSDVLGGFRAAHPDMPVAELERSSSLEKTGACVGDTQAAVASFLSGLGIDPAQLTFHVGWFQDTVPAVCKALGSLAILRIDGDWYESTKVCLQHLYENVTEGGFIIIDDYGTFSGCRKAVDEVMREKGIASNRLLLVDQECAYFRK